MAKKIPQSPFNPIPRIVEHFSPISIQLPRFPDEQVVSENNWHIFILPICSFFIVFTILLLNIIGIRLNWEVVAFLLSLSIVLFFLSFIAYKDQEHNNRIKRILSLQEYHRILDKKEARLFSGEKLQNMLLNEQFPDPNRIFQRAINLETSIWNRRRTDPDFLCLRIGTGELISQVFIEQPDLDIANLEKVRAIKIYNKYKTLKNAPIHINFPNLGSIALVGEKNKTIPLAYALLAQIVVQHAPTDVHIYIFSSEQRHHIWKWARWLPHASNIQTGGQPTFLAFKRNESLNIFTNLSQDIDLALQTEHSTKTSNTKPTRFIILDDEYGIRDTAFFEGIIKKGPEINVCSLIICKNLEDVPSECQGILALNKDTFTFSKPGEVSENKSGKYEVMKFNDIDNIAHSLVSVSSKLEWSAEDIRIPNRVNLLQSYNTVSIEELGIKSLWQRIPTKNELLPFPITIGNETYSSSFDLRLVENFDGPHGIVAGTTGSGKSELLQTLVNSLAIKHHPYLLNFLLIDFKGGSTFGVFEKLPHTVGLVHNLDYLSAIRVLGAIQSESTRRQMFLRDQGVDDINEYHEKLFRLGSLSKHWEPMPHLIIIIDEIGQMAHDMPVFIPNLVAAARIGRSLGFHLILATQRPAGIINDEMRANLNFRICLRVQTIDDSRDILKRPDAAFLSIKIPGRAFFQLGDGGILRQFQVARSGKDYQESSENITDEVNQIYKIEYETKVLIENPSLEFNRHIETKSISRALTEYMINLYSELDYELPPAILAQPLPPQISANELINHANQEVIKQVGTNYGRWNKAIENWDGKTSKSQFKVPVGLIDSLLTRSQPVLWINFHSYDGNAIVVGGPQSGKTGVLLTLIHNICIEYNPGEVNIYIISFAGREIEVTIWLPHVGSLIYGTDENEKLGRLFRYLNTQIEYRKRELSRHRAKDLREYHSSASTTETIPNICILIDDFGELILPGYEEILAEITRIMRIGRLYGIHFVITAQQPNDIPTKILNLIQQRIALNPINSEGYTNLIGKLDFSDFSSLSPGNAFISGSPPLQCRIAKPPEKDEWAQLSQSMQKAWKDKKKPLHIKELPRSLFLSDIWRQNNSRQNGDLACIVGVDGDTLEPLVLDLNQFGPHLLIGGPIQSGRTSVLHSIVLGLANEFPPDKLWIVLLDGANGSLRSLTSLPHVIDWVNEEDGLARNVAHLLSELKFRRTQLDAFNPKVPPPQIIFVIDDFELTKEALEINSKIEAVLARCMRQDYDLGFHLVAAILDDEVSSSSSTILRQLRLVRSGISLINSNILDYLGIRLSTQMHNDEIVQGRGYIANRSSAKLVQFAQPDTRQGELSIYQKVALKWGKVARASWANLANHEEIEQIRISSQ